MRALGPRQRELLAYIGDGTIKQMKGLRSYFWVNLNDDGHRQLITIDRVFSLIDRGLLVKVKSDWKSATYRVADSPNPESLS